MYRTYIWYVRIACNVVLHFTLFTKKKYFVIECLFLRKLLRTHTISGDGRIKNTNIDILYRKVIRIQKK